MAQHCCSCRGPGFGSQHSYDGSCHVAGNLVPSSGISEHQEHSSVLICMQAKIIIHIKVNHFLEKEITEFGKKLRGNCLLGKSLKCVFNY